MARIREKLSVDGVLEKYGLPKWIKPYAYSYIKGNPIVALKRAKSFIDVGRKKGEVNSKYVRLPNGMMFEKHVVEHLLTLFYYAEERMSEISKRWSEDRGANSERYSEYFSGESYLEANKARALKNLIEGLGLKLGSPPEEMEIVFKYLDSLSEWRDRIIAKEIILRDAYAKSFGFVFYKTFYPVSPELMRMLSKAFDKGDEIKWGEEEAKRIILENLDSEKILELTNALLARIYYSIEANMQMAKRAKLEREVMLLRDIAIAYPLHTLEELGAKVKIDDEIKRIKAQSKNID